MADPATPARGSLENRARFARDVLRSVREEAGDAVAVTAKIRMTEGSPVGFSIPGEPGVRADDEADGHLDALELSAGSSSLKPMYLFRGEVPLKEFAAAMPQPVRLGLRTPAGKRFFKAYPFAEAYLRNNALGFLGSTLDAADQIYSGTRAPSVIRAERLRTSTAAEDSKDGSGPKATPVFQLPGRILFHAL